MKIFRGVVIVGMLVTSQWIGHSQTTATQVSEPESDTEVMMQAIESTQPVPANKTPTFGTFYSAQFGEQRPPFPGNVLNLPFWSVGDGFYIMDDRCVDYDQLQAEAEAAAALSELSRGSASAMSNRLLNTAIAYGNPVYLTNLAEVLSGSDVTASFTVVGGTNNVPYDILTTTNLTNTVSQWDWLGIGYTSNSYSFPNQSADLAFYLLAKPQKTMVVGWGNDQSNQCDVPFGISNAVMVAGGLYHGIALLADGTVSAWGDNSSGQGSVPANLPRATMVAAGYNFNVVLLTNGTVTAWGDGLAPLGYTMTNVPPGLSNVMVISAQADHSLALRSNGTVVAWGYNGAGETNVPAGLTNVVAISAGSQHSLAALANGTVTAWGGNTFGQIVVPSGLSNIVDVAAGVYHSLALRRDGTVIAWGRNTYGEANVPSDLSNVVAIAAGGSTLNNSSYSLALKNDGTVVKWGNGEALQGVGGLSNVIGIGAGANHVLAIRTGPRTPVITVEPTDQYQVAGGNVTFTSRGAGVYGVTYQWQTNGVNLPGATSATLSLANVQASQEAQYNVRVSNEVGSILSSNAVFHLVTPPVITYQSQPTNQVCIYGNILSFSVNATAPGESYGYPLSYQWKFNGANISNATSSSYSFTADDNSSGTYSVVVANAAGSTSASWQVTVTNAIDVSKDLLLVYNTNSSASTAVLNYYIAHRPMVSGANVLGIGCPTNEIASSSTFSNQILAPYSAWLVQNPSKRPQYVVLFPEIPSRVEDGGIRYPSVQYQISTGVSGTKPYLTSLNMGGLNGTNDCIAYINKIQTFGANYSPGQLIISGTAGGYANTSYYFDNVRDPGYSTYGWVISNATNGVIANATPPYSITYRDGSHITTGTNVAGYASWGIHGGLSADYATNGAVAFSNSSGWWIIHTVESFNGQKIQDEVQGNFVKWFASNAFAGSNYSNTPVGAISHVEEPTAVATDTSIYFGLWASGKNFAICAWNADHWPAIQVVGDPFVRK